MYEHDENEFWEKFFSQCLFHHVVSPGSILPPSSKEDAFILGKFTLAWARLSFSHREGNTKIRPSQMIDTSTEHKHCAFSWGLVSSLQGIHFW